jgi:hypothetical protein
VVSMLLNIASPHLQMLSKAFNVSVCRKRLCKRNGAKSQRALNVSLLGDEFDLATRYAQLVNTMFTIMLFSAGMPILIPIGMAYVVVLFWVDKFLLLRYHRTPPQYGVDLGQTMLRYLPWCIVGHLAFAVWMLSNSSVFSTVSIEQFDANAGTVSAVPLSARLLKQAPLLVFLVLLLGFLILSILFRVVVTGSVMTTLLKMFKLCSRSCGCICCNKAPSKLEIIQASIAASKLGAGVESLAKSGGNDDASKRQASKSKQDFKVGSSVATCGEHKSSEEIPNCDSRFAVVNPLHSRSATSGAAEEARSNATTTTASTSRSEGVPSIGSGQKSPMSTVERSACTKLLTGDDTLDSEYRLLNPLPPASFCSTNRLFDGLDTYSIFANPTISQAFAVSHADTTRLRRLTDLILQPRFQSP